MSSGNEILCSKSSPEVQSNLLLSHESHEEFFGPALPSHLLGKKKENDQKIYGPVLPDNFRQLQENENEVEINNLKFDKEGRKNLVIGPEIPEHLKLSDQTEKEEEVEESIDNSVKSCHNESDYIGPSPNLMSTESPYSYKLLESSHTEKKEDNKKKKRESWMLELPEKKRPSFDTSKRHFKTRSYTGQEDDRSVWTETPTEKHKQKEEKKEKDYLKLLKKQKLKERDEEMKLLTEKAKKKQPNSSLLEMHIKKLKKKKKKEKKHKKEGGEPKVRRPFDRNIDLQIHRIDESKKRNILSRAAFLNDRFAAGESKFL